MSPPAGAPTHELNDQVAQRLEDMAEVLDQQGADAFRSRAYRRAAVTVRGLARSVADILHAEGPAGLEALPGIGERITRAIVEMVDTGRWAQLERVTGELDAEQLFRSLPGVGPTLAARIHDTLGIDTLEALEVAAHDGRLAEVPGVGPRRADMIRSLLHERLGRRRLRPVAGAAPGVALLLDVDAEYRRRAAAGELRQIAPKRFNPEQRAWLPILHTTRNGWQFTALFSNTARAHEFGKTDDWVVIYAHRDEGPEVQHTVVTETGGPLAGQRVVRGREAECPATPAPATC